MSKQTSVRGARSKKSRNTGIMPYISALGLSSTSSIARINNIKIFTAVKRAARIVAKVLVMEEEDVDIAAAMGFGSFGGTKKRKFDHTSSPKSKAESSGANSTKLGMRTKKQAGAGDENVGDSSTNQGTQAQPQPPAPTMTTQETPAASGLAAFLARGQALPETSEDAQIPHRAPVEDDPSATDMISFGGPPISRAEVHALRFGVQNERGDTAYFLPSFVEDPWSKLSKSGAT